jgi:predicted enzyme related to lactoylglutathione lyase
MPVLGIGGLFFRARDPEALTAWYRDHLNVGPGCVATPGAEVDKWSWQAQGGATVFQPFKDATDYWDAGKQVMLNLRVSEIDALLETLRAAGIDAITKPEWDDPHTGRFARIHDPEGNPIELWQPPAD